MASPKLFYTLSITYSNPTGTLRASTSGGTSSSTLWGPSFTSGYYYKGTLKQPGTFSTSSYGDRKTRGVKARGTGAIILHNSGGEYNNLAAASFEGKLATLRLCRWEKPSQVASNSPLAPFGIDVFTERIEGDEESVTIYIRDANFQLDKEILTEKFLGTNVPPNGLEGEEGDVGGKLKPKGFGICKNIRAPRANNQKLIYLLDVNGFRAGWSVQAFDQYFELVEDAAGDYASEADLLNDALAPAATQWRAYPAGGMVRLGSSPVGDITWNLTNPCPDTAFPLLNDPVFVTNNELHAVVRALGEDAGLVGHMSADFPFGTVPDAGIYIQDNKTYAEAIAELSASINASCSLFGTSGLQASQIEDPALAVGALPLYAHHIRDIRKVPSADDDRGIPAWRVTVRYAKNYTPMNGSQVAGGVSDEDRAFVENEYREVYAEDPAVKTAYPTSKEIICTTLLVNAADAQAEADRLLALYKVQREFFEVEMDVVTVTAPNFNLYVGYVREIFYDAYDFASGKNVLFIGADYDLERGIIVFTVWC